MLPIDPLVEYREWYLVHNPLQLSGLTAAKISQAIYSREGKMCEAEVKVYRKARTKLNQILFPCKACQDLHRRCLALCHLIEGWDSFAVEIMVETITKQHRSKSQSYESGKQPPIYSFLASELRMIYESIGIQWSPCEPDSKSYITLAQQRRREVDQSISKLQAMVNDQQQSIDYRKGAAEEAKRKFGIDLEIKTA